MGFLTAVPAVHEGLDIAVPFLPESTIEGGANQPQTILVLGGASSVGSSAIQILRMSLPQATVIATASSKNHAQVTSLGANHVIDYKKGDVVDQIDQATSQNGVDAILDAVNGVTLQPELLGLLAKSNGKKKLFSEVLTGNNLPSSKVPEGVEQRQIAYTSILKKPGAESLLKSLTGMLRDEEYVIPIPVTKVGTGFDCIGQGLLTLKNGGVSGTKLVVMLE